jgi:hypothetical protein
MIRLATHEDTYLVVDLLKKFLTETSYAQGIEASKDLEHLCKIVWTMKQHGYIWLAFKDERPVGLLMSVVESNMWIPKIRELREICWYVIPEVRKTSIGGKLFLNYCKKGEELLELGLIQGYFTTQMTTTDNLNLESRGFRLTESTYLKEH